MITYKYFKDEVRRTLGNDCFYAVRRYVIAKDPKLWGLEQPDDFLEKNLVLCIFKDIEFLGYARLRRMIWRWLKVSDKTLRHNFKIIRKILKRWGKRQIISSDANVWNNVANNIRRGRHVQNVNLLQDSSDFPERGNVPKTDPYHSFKLNCKGRRFQVIIDLLGRVKGLFGGYSPKVYDAHWLEICRPLLERKFQGGVIAADTHYNSKINLDGITYVVPNYPNVVPIADNTADLTVLTNEQKMKNNQIHKLRARVESPFGLIKNKFKSLNSKFGDNKEQHDCLVFFAIGVHNFNL